MAMVRVWIQHGDALPRLAGEYTRAEWAALRTLDGDQEVRLYVPYSPLPLGEAYVPKESA